VRNAAYKILGTRFFATIPMSQIQHKATKAHIIAASKQLPPYIKPAPTINTQRISFLNTFIDDPINSFKSRGVYTKFKAEIDRKIAEGYEGKIIFSVASEGNHSQGAAKASAYFAGWLKENHPKITLECNIYMPSSSPEQKRNKTEEIGQGYANVITIEGIFDDAKRQAQKDIQSKEAAFFVSPFDDPYIVTGHGSVFPTVRDDFDYVVTGLGGGGLTAGAAAYFKDGTTKIIGVQPAWVPSMVAALCKEEPIELDSKFMQECFAQTNAPDFMKADGAIIARAGDWTASILEHYGTRVETATPQQIAYVFKAYVNSHATNEDGSINYEKVPELAGVLSLVGLYKQPELFADKKVLCVLTGGNIAPERVDKVMEYAEQFKHFPDARTPFFDPNDTQSSLDSLKGWVSEKQLNEISKLNTIVTQVDTITHAPLQILK